MIVVASEAGNFLFASLREFATRILRDLADVGDGNPDMLVPDEVGILLPVCGYDQERGLFQAAVVAQWTYQLHDIQADWPIVLISWMVLCA